MNFFPEGTLIDTIKNRQATSSITMLGNAISKKEILEGRAIVCDAQHNLIVELPNKLKGIIPRSEGAIGMDTGDVRDIAVLSRVNKPVCFIVTDFSTVGDEIIPILSRRKAQEICEVEYISTLYPGQIIDAVVTHLEPFGAFVDIGCGISSLIPIDSISISRISHPCDRFKVGQKIRAVVSAVEGTRVFLSHKELLGTWEENAALFSQGETVAGIVRSVESYGIFIELSPNLAGLAEPKEGVCCNQHASVYIKSLIPQRMKVKLIVIDSFDAQYPPRKLQYFNDCDFLSSWKYSPDSCERVIETFF